jgi:hypothetical protein
MGTPVAAVAALEVAVERRHAYALSAIATSTGVAALELCSVVSRHPWPGLTPWWSYANSIFTVAVMGVAAVALSLRNVGAPFFAAAWWIGYVSAGYLVIHALNLRFSGNSVALIEAPLGLLLILFVRRAMNPADPEVLRKHPHFHLPRWAGRAAAT